jgi:hypothetical protein
MSSLTALCGTVMTLVIGAAAAPCEANACFLKEAAKTGFQL